MSSIERLRYSIVIDQLQKELGLTNLQTELDQQGRLSEDWRVVKVATQSIRKLVMLLLSVGILEQKFGLVEIAHIFGDGQQQSLISALGLLEKIEQIPNPNGANDRQIVVYSDPKHKIAWVSGSSSGEQQPLDQLDPAVREAVESATLDNKLHVDALKKLNDVDPEVYDVVIAMDAICADPNGGIVSKPTDETSYIDYENFADYKWEAILHYLDHLAKYDPELGQYLITNVGVIATRNYLDHIVADSITFQSELSLFLEIMKKYFKQVTQVSEQSGLVPNPFLEDAASGAMFQKTIFGPEGQAVATSILQKYNWLWPVEPRLLQEYLLLFAIMGVPFVLMQQMVSKALEVSSEQDDKGQVEATAPRFESAPPISRAS